VRKNRTFGSSLQAIWQTITESRIQAAYRLSLRGGITVVKSIGQLITGLQPSRKWKRNLTGLIFEQLEERSVPSAVRITDINALGSSLPQGLVTFNGHVYFSADDGIHGRELWRTDGTSTGTVMISDISPGSSGSNPGWLTPVGSWLYFAAFRSDVGVELWRTDGTTVQLVGDLYPGTASSNPHFLTAVGDTLFFAATDGVAGTELWMATSSGAVRVKDIALGSTSSAPNQLTNVSGTLFFSAWTPDSGRELWKSDGTEAGTVQVADINQVVPVPPLSSANLDSDPQYLVNVGGVLYFSANDGIHGRELWKSDGTSSGTQLVLDIVPGAASSYPTNLVNANGTLFFAASRPEEGRELWRSDGTTSGTFLVRDINPGTYSSYPQQMVNVGGMLFFVANDGSNGFEVWRSDGTSSGTILLRDIRPGSLSSYPSGMREFNGGVVFAANDGNTGTEIWRSLGSPANTELLDDVLVGSISSSPSEFTNLNGQLVFRAQDVSGDIEPYILDARPTNITGFIRPSAALYKRGSALDFRVIFNNVVTVDTVGGIPAIALEIGGRVRLATYLNGSGTNILTFRYVVRSDDLDLDGIEIRSPILLRGGSIQGPANTPASLTFTPPVASSVRVDGVAPRIVSVQGPRPGFYRPGQRLRFFVFTSEPVYWSGGAQEPYLEIIIGGQARRANLITGSGTSRLVFDYTISREDRAPQGIWIRQRIFVTSGSLADAAGNSLYLSFMPPDLRKVRI
jgi:ELWxxDGT repeat protein